MDGDWLITPGTVVRLRSGSPWYTVETVEGDTAHCVRVSSGFVFRQEFNRAALERRRDVSWWHR
jgi:hypothetical protein